MNVTSVHYIAFLAAAIFSYLLSPARHKKKCLLISSIIFCSFFGIDSITVISLCIAFNYLCGLQLNKLKESINGKRFLVFSVLVNVLLLATHKYAFAVTGLLGLILPSSLRHKLIFDTHYVVPVGLSFYVFQSISYLVDIHRQKIVPERSVTIFSLYILFFPKIIAGPIERATSLLPQFHAERKLNYEQFRHGIALILWGFFQKIVIADRIGVYVDAAYASPQACHGIAAWIAIIFYSFQIYSDFSGYTDIARGTAKLFGYELTINFRQPYLATSIQDFWRRWHISLSSWLRDYVYIPLGGGRVRIERKILNILVVFIVCGFWHGSSWTFVVWGALHGLFVAFEVVITKLVISGSVARRLLPAPVSNAAKVFFTFVFVSVAWVFFKAESVDDGITLLKNSLDFHAYSLNIQDGLTVPQIILSFFLILFICSVNIVQTKLSLSRLLFSQSRPIRWAVYYLFIFAIILLPGGSGISRFIYNGF